MRRFDNQPNQPHPDSAALLRSLLASSLLSAAAACSSSGGGQVPSSGGFLPPATASHNRSIELIENPPTQEFVTASGGGEVNDLGIRYDVATGQYSVQFDGYLIEGYNWYPLIDDPNAEPLPGQPNLNFVVDGLRNAYVAIRASHQSQEPAFQYHYSNLAAWSAFGVVSQTAFGVATPTADIPKSGSASYEGLIEGISSAPSTGWDNEIVPAYVSGSVDLHFQFDSGTLNGEMRPVIHTDELLDLGSIPLSGSIATGPYGPYAGQFDTPVAGDNSFLGWFTGPAAEELIGGWTLPFVNPVDGNVYSATGAWIAKKQEPQP